MTRGQFIYLGRRRVILLAVILASRCSLAGDQSPAAEFAANWHQWRGPNANGSAADSATPPLQWDVATNIEWARELPGEGSATPVVWGNQVFAVSAERTDRKAETPTVSHESAKTILPDVFYRFIVTSIDRSTGDVQWQKVATEQVPHEGHHDSHTYAAGSPSTDGERLYASFGSRGIYCYTLSGELVWQKDLGDMRTRFAWGEAVTPALAANALIVNWDQEEGSFVVALDKVTGNELWRKDRPGEKTSWNTPFVTEFNGRTLAILNGSGKARAYDVANGDVVWECGGQTTNAIPSAIRFGNDIICMSGYRGAAAFCIPLDSKGDVTGTDTIRWAHPEGTPYVPSPTLAGDRILFTGGNSDILSCLDAATGESLIDRRRIPRVGGLYASPLAANGYLYFVGREGTTAVLKDNATLELVGTNHLEGLFDASPIAVGNQLFLRSWNKVYCIAQ
ncbi:MAG: PQQ-like beta-propeller repeat protein [Planctomycetota bacterium]|nr:PQQ-like beta-propeller repeat protein [Planctomycetota bacterium]